MPVTSGPRSPWALVMMLIGVLLMVGSGVWYFSLEPPTAPVDTPDSVVLEDPYANIPRVSAADAKVAYDSGAAVFIDIRDSDAFAQGRIPGAILIPLSELPERYDELETTAWIITYCT